MSEFYLGLIARKSGDWQEVVTRLGDYAATFPSQDSYGKNADFATIQAHLELGQPDQAEAQYAEMKSRFGGDSTAGKAANLIYRALAEVEDPDSELTRRKAEYISDSNDSKDSPAFDELRLESRLWLDVGNHTEAESLLKKLVTKWGEDEAHAKIMAQNVKPDLGRVLLAQGDVQGAVDVLDALVPHPENLETIEFAPYSPTVVTWMHAAVGRVGGEGREIVEHPGVGGAENFQRAAAWADRRVKAMPTDEKWTCAWYERKFDLAYVYYKWSEVDSNKREAVKQQIDFLTNYLGASFEGQAGVPGMTEACGGDETLTRRYLWLYGQVR